LMPKFTKGSISCSDNKSQQNKQARYRHLNKKCHQLNDETTLNHTDLKQYTYIYIYSSLQKNNKG
jgi:ribose 5-phosphate isomerase RpiB